MDASIPVEDQKALDEAFVAEIEARQRDAKGVLPEMVHARQLAEHLKLAGMVEMATNCTGLLSAPPDIDLWDGPSAHDLR